MGDHIPGPGERGFFKDFVIVFGTTLVVIVAEIFLAVCLLGAFIWLAHCATAEPLDPRAFDAAGPDPTCDECWPGCSSPANDRDAYWCVRNCVRICDAERAKDGGDHG